MIETENEKNNKKRIIGIVTTVMLIASVVFCLFVALQVFRNGYASFGKYSMFRVVTGSMEPDIEIGSLIVTQNVEIDKVNVGDVVSFRSRSADMAGSIITHRVIDKSRGDNNIVLLYTKGDANTTQDSLPVDSGNYIGKVTKVFGGDNFLTNLIAFFTCESGFIVCIVLPVLVVSALIMQRSIKSIKRDMSALVSEIDKMKQRENTNQASVELEKDLADGKNASDSSGLTDDEYRELYDKIKSELAAEIKEELRESDKR